jgi:ATP-binding cassette subfamily B protein
MGFIDGINSRRDWTTGDWRAQRLFDRTAFMFRRRPFVEDQTAAGDPKSGGLCGYANHPLAFLGRYIRQRPISHVAILIGVIAAAACSVATQYGVKFLVDALSQSARFGQEVWTAFLVLVTLIAADNLLWRLAGWIASQSFVGVTGDVRRDLFRHLTGHAPSYFTERMPGMLTSRITATSNAVYAIESLFVWNVLPPCVATIGAVLLVMTVSVPIAAALTIISGILVVVMFRLAAAGRPLHHHFADTAAAVDGEMVDVIGNMPLVCAFGGIAREHHRFDDTVNRELAARQRSLRYLEKLRLFHAAVTVLLTVGVLACAIMLWQRGAASTGDVVLLCTLGLSVLHATRDLAVALVEATQHIARLSEALATLLVPHAMRDHPQAEKLSGHGANIALKDVSFSYPDTRKVFERFNLRIEAGQRIGLVGPSGSGKTTICSLIQRYYEIQDGRILINDRDISRVTQESLRGAIAVVPQDISLFHRSLAENIRYGRPSASDQQVLEAAHAARCTDFIATLPEGIGTIVGDRGVKLSGGQRQRIAIARAFLKDAPILLLDEATSALDSDSEEAIRDALDRLMHGRTVLAIAHRLSTLRSFDRIIVLQGGLIVQDGPPDSLARQQGLYRELLHREISRLTPQAA